MNRDFNAWLASQAQAGGTTSLQQRLLRAAAGGDNEKAAAIKQAAADAGLPWEALLTLTARQDAAEFGESRAVAKRAAFLWQEMHYPSLPEGFAIHQDSETTVFFNTVTDRVLYAVRPGGFAEWRALVIRFRWQHEPPEGGWPEEPAAFVSAIQSDTWEEEGYPSSSCWEEEGRYYYRTASERLFAAGGPSGLLVGAFGPDGSRYCYEQYWLGKDI